MKGGALINPIGYPKRRGNGRKIRANGQKKKGCESS